MTGMMYMLFPIKRHVHRRSFFGVALRCLVAGVPLVSG